MLRHHSPDLTGHIQISDATWQLLQEQQNEEQSAAVSEWIPSGGVEVKGKGRMDTYVWSMPPGFMDSPVNMATLTDSCPLLRLFAASQV